MPLLIPTLDDRTYQQLLDDGLARVPIHNPEWTNFNDSDPGVTLIQVFAFLTDNLLFRSNQIPERNRLKFLSLLNVPLRAASSARGIVTFNNARGPLQNITLNDGIEVRAGQVPFRTTMGLDVLPIEAQVFFKREKTDAGAAEREYYQLLFKSYLDEQQDASALRLYETIPLPPRATVGVNLAQAALDHSLWVALLVREGDKPYAEKVKDARKEIKGRTISLGIAPYIDPATRSMLPGGQVKASSAQILEYKIPIGGVLSQNKNLRVPKYQTLGTSPIPIEPTVVQITLPNDEAQLELWDNFDPLEQGTLDFPPTLKDTTLSERVITWLRVVAPASGQFQALWAGINATYVFQRAHVANELLPDGSGEPDQAVTLAKTPVLRDSVTLTVKNPNGESKAWKWIDDLAAAGPEVPTTDFRQPPGYPPEENKLVQVFALDPEAGVIRFGDGTRGARPSLDAEIRASYDYGVGRAGNVGADAINSGPALPAGIQVTNPLRTWGGADGETVSEGEKQIARYLQHRDRLVNATDFETITLRTPGVDIGRVEVLSAFNPALGQSEGGGTPGAVTLMVIPKYDARFPDTPEPDATFLNAICHYLDPRRLVTTELFLRGPAYVPLWISVGINVIGGTPWNTTDETVSIAQVQEAVNRALLDYLSPLPPLADALDAQANALATPQYAATQRGWQLNKAVVDRELMAVASRVTGVLSVNDVQLLGANGVVADEIPIKGLELPRVMGIAVALGDPTDVKSLRGQPTSPELTNFKPVPFVPEECD